MEKKRSPRSSRSPGTEIFSKSPLIYNNYKSGCGWKLINFFDLRHVKSGNKRLNSDKKFIRDSVGNVYTKSQIGLLKRLHEKCQCNDRIVEEENPCKAKARRRSLNSGNENGKYESREIRRIKNLKDETCLRSSSEIEKTNDKDKQMDLKNGRGCKKSSEISLKVCLNEAAETLICPKAEEKAKERSKQFMEALDILSSNKELFITLLQDPKSFSARKGQDLEGSTVKELRDDLKPRLTSSVDDGVYLRFKHLAKKLKLVVGSNKEEKPEGSGFKARETEDAAFRKRFGHGSSEPSVFRRKKRVESDVFKLSTENNVSPRRFIMGRQQERLDSSPVYEVPYAWSSLQTKLKGRRQKLEKKRESLKLWSLYNNFEVFDPNPHNSDLRSLNDDCTGSTDNTSLRTHEKAESFEIRHLESSLAELNSSLDRRDSNPKNEQEQPSPVSVLESIHLEEETVGPGNLKISKLEIDPNIHLVEKDSVLEFVKKVLKASRLNWTTLMTKCSEETSLLDEFSHRNHQLLLVLDYTDEVLRGIYNQYIRFWPFVPLKSSRSLREEDDLIQETMRCFEWCYDSTRTLDQIIETDLIKPCLWLDFGDESESVVSDVVDKILQQLVLEISNELKNNA